MLYAAASDGLIHGNLNLADICYLIAVIVFFIVAFIRLTVQPRLLDGALVAIGLALVALGLLVT